ncbi:ligand-gated channel [Geothrix limicola]|uniref:Ligand-gated channel n=1 Tax=Geothrix limicola TaxID=2927978 RepID=A0ABQ5QB29_9BACT|nr:TonB-dependent siderophore receptor [Geothrix limicola]GLH71655.1 ligand-gated channel [Geothrix limicola]
MSHVLLLSLLACLSPQESPAQLPPAAEAALPEVKVKGKKAKSKERADGPVKGYRARRSATLTKTDTPLADLPQSVQVVPESLVKDQGMKSMAEVIRYVPGASMNPGEGGRDQPVLRGISTSSDFFVDGLRDDALYFRDPYNAERIEILKGPSGMTFGRGGGGGVVNRVTKRPLDQPLAQAELSLGSWDDKRGAVDLGGQLGGARYRVNGVAEDAKGFREGYQLRRSGLNPVVEFAPGSDTLALLSVEHFEDRRTTDRGLPALNGRPYEAPRERFFGDPAQSPSAAVVDAFTARVESNLAPNVLLRSTLRATRYDTLRQNVQPNSVVDPATGRLRISAYSQANLRINLFDQTELEWRGRVAGMDHLLLAGLELGHQDSENTRLTGYFGAAGTATTATVGAANPRASVTRWAAASSDTNNEVVANLAALYLQDQISLSSHWKAVLGLRYDRFAVALDDRNAANVDLAHTDKAASPRAGLIYQPTEASSYYLSYSYAFLPSSETLSLSASNADLKPEKATNWELGGKWDLSPGFALTAALFRLDRADVKSKDPNDPTKLVLSGLQRTDGLELGFQGQVTERWQVYGGFAQLDARVVKATGGSATSAAVPAGTQVPLVPRRAATCWNKVELTSQWALGLGLIHQSSSFASTTNAVILPAFIRADAAVYFSFGKQNRLSLNLENLLDRRYYPTAGNDYNIVVGSPRRAQLTLSCRF